MKKIYLLILGVLLCWGIQACSSQESSTSKKIKIVATTGMIADAIQNIMGDSVEVIALMGAGVDPHLYKATQGDLEKLSSADVIFYNGLHLEGKMGEIFEKLATQKKVIAFAEGIEKTKLRKISEELYDPHVWFDVEIWSKGVEYASTQLQSLYPDQKNQIVQRTQIYLQSLHALHQEVKNEINTIPANQKVLITSHDAFAYFGAAYSIEVKGLQGVSTVTEPGLQDITNLVNFIVERKIKAVFVETSVSDKAIREAVLQGCQAKGHEVKVGGTLFADAMGEKDTSEGTYIGMVKANLKTIVNALK